jgi:AGZA family xanthine/uracil permease-like MFS transporter
MREALESRFRISERGTSLKIEAIGGITTFVTMAYIIVVNPAILAFAGIPAGPSTVATILTAAFGCLLMGFYANLPIAVAPYMGENAFIAFGLAAMGIGWEQRLGTVFVSGALFLILTLLKLRGWLFDAIPVSLKLSFAVGIGLFLALIGLYETGIVTSGAAGMDPAALTLPTGLLRAPDVPLKIGALHTPQALLSVGCFLLICALLHRRVPGAILIGMAATGVAGIAMGLGPAPRALAATPFLGQYSLGDLAFRLDITGVLRLSLLPVLMTLFLMSFLDTLGTLVGVGAAAGMLREDGSFPEVEKPMTVDALTCMFAACVGTSTSGAYIESATGIREGARTGLAAVVTGLLFVAALFFIPLLEPLQRMTYAYGPALVVVGVLMAGLLTKLDLSDITEAAPALTSITMMVFTYSIGNGLTAGLVIYPVIKALAGRGRELKPGLLALSALCLVYFIFGLPH